MAYRVGRHDGVSPPPQASRLLEAQHLESVSSELTQPMRHDLHSVQDATTPPALIDARSPTVAPAPIPVAVHVHSPHQTQPHGHSSISMYSHTSHIRHHHHQHEPQQTQHTHHPRAEHPQPAQQYQCRRRVQQGHGQNHELQHVMHQPQHHQHHQQSQCHIAHQNHHHHRTLETDVVQGGQFSQSLPQTNTDQRVVNTAVRHQPHESSSMTSQVTHTLSIKSTSIVDSSTPPSAQPRHQQHDSRHLHQGQSPQHQEREEQIVAVRVIVSFPDGIALPETKLEVSRTMTVDELKHDIARGFAAHTVGSPALITMTQGGSVLSSQAALHMLDLSVPLLVQLPPTGDEAKTRPPIRLPARIKSVGEALEYGQQLQASGVRTLADAKALGVDIKPKRLRRLLRWAKAAQVEPSAFTEEVKALLPASAEAQQVCERLVPPDQKHNGEVGKRKKWEAIGKTKRAAGLKEPSVPGLSHEAALFLDRVFHNAPRALPDHYLSFSLDHKQFFYTHKMTGAVQWVSTQEGLDQRVQEVRHALPLAGQHSQHTAPPMAPIEDALSPTSPMPTLEQLTD
eukprot:m.290877 g.290877  ORF g.290877 m.290877 type:complete len:567 (-) comp15820_c1_seq4:165-1865(-)